MSFLTRWFGRWASRDRRKAERHPLPGLVAYYWTGAASVAQSVRDISSKGLYLLTEERWYPGTVVKITLQRTDAADSDSMRSITVQARVVRWGEDGVGLAFALPDVVERRQLHREVSVDRKILEAFLQQLSEDGLAFSKLRSTSPLYLTEDDTVE